MLRNILHENTTVTNDFKGPKEKQTVKNYLNGTGCEDTSGCSRGESRGERVGGGEWAVGSDWGWVVGG